MVEKVKRLSVSVCVSVRECECVCVRSWSAIPLFCNIEQEPVTHQSLGQKSFDWLAGHLALFECVQLRYACGAGWQPGHSFVLTLCKRRQPDCKDLYPRKIPARLCDISKLNFLPCKAHRRHSTKHLINKWTSEQIDKRKNESSSRTLPHCCRIASWLMIWVVQVTRQPSHEFP